MLTAFSKKNTSFYFLFFLTFSILYAFLTYPALFGSFELDDSANLIGLARINHFDDIIRFTFDGLSSRLGRPVTLFTFALQADSWPNPFDFKLVNLLLHLLNGGLILIFLLQLFAGQFNNRQTAVYFCLVVYAVWLLAPIHVFATFYSIQRMTLLSGFFVLLALNSHIYIRKTILVQNCLKGYIMLSLSFGICLVLGVLSKESAILLCIYLLVTEATLLRYETPPKFWPLWKITALWLPILILIVYLGQTGRLYYTTSDIYGFDSYQRLINQLYIVWDYIRLIIFPKFGAYGLIHDDYKMIHSLSDNYGLMILASSTSALIAMAAYLRKKAPIITFSILWFFGGHLLESTVIPLELYFEHRNYLPSLGVIIIYVYGLFRFYQLISHKWIKYGFLFSVLGYSLIYGFVLKETALSWSSEIALSNYQMKYHPDSRRAKIRHVTLLMSRGQFQQAAQLMSQLDKKNKWVIGHNLQLQQLNCFEPTLFKAPERELFFEILKTGKFDFAIDAAIEEILQYKINKQCPSLSYDDFRDIISALQSNPNLGPSKVFLAVMKSKTFSENEQWDEAITALLEAPVNEKKNINYDFILLQYQYMAKDWQSAEITIKKIELRLEQEPVNRYALTESLQMFRDHISKQKQLN